MRLFDPKSFYHSEGMPTRVMYKRVCLQRDPVSIGNGEVLPEQRLYVLLVPF